MIKNVFVSLCCLSIALVIGCQKTEKPNPGKTDEIPKTAVDSSQSTSTGYVEPLVPKKDDASPAAPDSENPASEEKSDVPVSVAEPKTSAVHSGVDSKFAATPVFRDSAVVLNEDLTDQVNAYVEGIGKALEDLDGSSKYAEDASAIVRDASGLILVVKGIGLGDAADSKYKKAAGQIIAAAKKLIAAQSLEEGQKAYDALKSSLEGKGDAAAEPLDWSKKTADLKPLMKAVPNLSSAIKRVSGTEKKLTTQLKKKPAAIFGNLAALVVIAQGSIANVGETTKPDAVAEWKKECEQLRATALKANETLHDYADGRADFAAVTKAVEDVNESCHACHKIFSPENAEK